MTLLINDRRLPNDALYTCQIYNIQRARTLFMSMNKGSSCKSTECYVNDLFQLKEGSLLYCLLESYIFCTGEYTFYIVSYSKSNGKH